MVLRPLLHQQDVISLQGLGVVDLSKDTTEMAFAARL
jgi:hypothetical protein